MNNLDGGRASTTGLFYYIVSMIISTVLYFKMKMLDLTEEEKSAFKTVIIIPYFNVILMMWIFIRNIELLQELEEMEKFEDDS